MPDVGVPAVHLDDDENKVYEDVNVAADVPAQSSAATPFQVQFVLASGSDPDAATADVIPWRVLIHLTLGVDWICWQDFAGFVNPVTVQLSADLYDGYPPRGVTVSVFTKKGNRPTSFSGCELKFA